MPLEKEVKSYPYVKTPLKSTIKSKLKKCESITALEAGCLFGPLPSRQCLGTKMRPSSPREDSRLMEKTTQLKLSPTYCQSKKRKRAP